MPFFLLGLFRSVLLNFQIFVGASQVFKKLIFRLILLGSDKVLCMILVFWSVLRHICDIVYSLSWLLFMCPGNECVFWSYWL